MSTTPIRRLRLPGSSVLAGMVLALVLVGAGAAGSRMLAAPTAVATVDFRVVLEGLDQRKDELARINQLENDLTAEAQAKADELNSRREGLLALVEKDQAGTITEAERTQMTELENDLRYEDFVFTNWKNRAQQKVDHEYSLAMRDLHRAIKAEAAEVARISGYDLILIDDSERDLAVDPTAGNLRAQVSSQLSQRRVLFVSRPVDISRTLVDRMNNAWNAGATP